jgi:hypothetical protein
MKTIELNKLIAEFMQDEILYRPYSNGFIEMSDTEICDVDDLEYHKFWDLLMPVVDKIENLGYEFFIVEDRVRVAHNTDHSTKTIIEFTLGGSKRDATYNGVVEFIKFYRTNYNNKQNNIRL